MVRHKRLLFNGEKDIDSRMIGLVIDMYLSEKFDKKDLYFNTMLFAYKYLRDDERENNREDSFLKRYYDEFISLVFDVDYEEYLNDFFELGDTWEKAHHNN